MSVVVWFDSPTCGTTLKANHYRFEHVHPQGARCRFPPAPCTLGGYPTIKRIPDFAARIRPFWGSEAVLCTKLAVSSAEWPVSAPFSGFPGALWGVFRHPKLAFPSTIRPISARDPALPSPSRSCYTRVVTLRRSPISMDQLASAGVWTLSDRRSRVNARVGMPLPGSRCAQDTPRIWHGRCYAFDLMKANRQPLPPAKLVTGKWVRISPELMDSRVRSGASPRIITLRGDHHISKPARRERTPPAH